MKNGKNREGNGRSHPEIALNLPLVESKAREQPGFPAASGGHCYAYSLNLGGLYKRYDYTEEDGKRRFLNETASKARGRSLAL